MVAEETGWSEQSLVYSTHELLHTAAAQGERGGKERGRRVGGRREGSERGERVRKGRGGTGEERGEKE